MFFFFLINCFFSVFFCFCDAQTHQYTHDQIGQLAACGTFLSCEKLSNKQALFTIESVCVREREVSVFAFVEGVSRYNRD